MAVSQAQLHDQSLRYLKGVGPGRMEQLARLGLRTVGELCLYPPRRYEDRAQWRPIRELTPGETATVRGRVLAKGARRVQGSRSLVEVALGDATGVLYGVWFHQPYLAQQLQVGEELILHGRVERRVRLQLVHPELERVGEGADHSLHMGRIVPVYPLKADLSQRWFRQVVWTALERSRGSWPDPLPEALRASRGWPSMEEAVRRLHFPDTFEQLEQARQRLVFDELFVFQLALAQRRAATMARQKPQRYRAEGALIHGLRERLPFQLTAAQQRVLEELLGDLGRPYPMQRLLQGDVGCGKTIVMVWLLATAVQSGHQAALMVPTELLAEQHARVVSSYLQPLGVSVGRLSQGVAPAEQARCLRAIAEGRIDVAIGTHALLQQRVTFPRLALALIDEQHKFGVAQRARLAKKAQEADVLVVTATPIPRTLAMTLYGDLEVSTIGELPAGRSPITTRWMREAQRPQLYAMLQDQLALGRQAYIVYPLVHESAAEVRAASQMAAHLQRSIFPSFRIGLLHGQMKPKDKEQTMAAFVRGELQLLVSTVIVEVGLDVPNATLMVIEHPERFGLAQLHQLRGRIGRGAHPATCVVLSDAAEPSVQQRLQAFVRARNGFELAEQDLELRGPGELTGRLQHGWLRFRLADLVRDRALLELACREARALMAVDAPLEQPHHQVLKERVGRLRQPAAAGAVHADASA